MHVAPGDATVNLPIAHSFTNTSGGFDGLAAAPSPGVTAQTPVQMQAVNTAMYSQHGCNTQAQVSQLTDLAEPNRHGGHAGLCMMALVCGLSILPCLLFPSSLPCLPFSPFFPSGSPLPFQLSQCPPWLNGRLRLEACFAWSCALWAFDFVKSVRSKRPLE